MSSLKKNFFKKISYFFWSLVILIIFSSILIRFNIVKSLFGYQLWVVRTQSMAPRIKAGDLIISSLKTKNNYSVGTVIVFETFDDSLLTHRIVDKKEDYFVTKGDANELVDQELVKKESIKGQVCFKIPILGKMFLFIQTFSGKMFIGIVLLIFFVFQKLLLLIKKENQEEYHEK